MLRGFFDESNKDRAEGRFVLAGWIASVDTWERFTEAWDSALKGFSLNYFKHAGASDAKTLTMSQIISEHDLRGYVVTVDYDLLTSKPVELRKRMGTRVYDWAFMKMVPGVLVDNLDRGSREKVDFVFDGCTELRTCIERYEVAREEWPPSMRAIAGEIIPGNDKELAALQAADLLAGEYAAVLRSGLKGEVYQALEVRPIAEWVANPPPLEPLWEYAKEVFEREAIVRNMLKLMKQHGVSLNDLKQ